MDRDYISVPSVIKVEFALEPVLSQFDSISLITQVDRLSGLGEWVVSTHDSLPTESLVTYALVRKLTGAMVHSLYSPLPEHRNVIEYLDWLAAQDLSGYFGRMLGEWMTYLAEDDEWLALGRPLPAPEVLLSSRAAFIEFAPAATGIEADAELWSQAFDLLYEPARLVAKLREQVGYIWEHFLADEWRRALPMLQESVEAFSRLNLTNVTLHEAVRAVTGRDLRGKFTAREEAAQRIVFIPSPHLGPYVSRMMRGSTIFMGYGARLPRGVQAAASPLSRSELLIRMNALADDTRLRILEMLTERDEMCAQEIIEALGLSQSSVSRHLSQLSATGFLSERRREAGKCYSLNTERIVDTVRALTNFLSRR